MSWIVVALAAAAVSGVVNMVDKTVLYRYARHPRTLPLMIGIIQMAIGAVLLVALPVPEDATRASVGWALASGALFGLATQFLFRVLFTEEVSRSIPIFQTFPIFTAIIATLFLDERLAPLQWLAIIATVFGAVLLSLRIDSEYRRLFLHRSFLLLMIGSLVAALSFIAGKVAVDTLPVLYAHGLRIVGVAGVFIAFNARPAPVREVARMVRTRSPALGFVGLNEVVLVNAALLLTLLALSLGSASPVTTLLATRSLFVFLYSTGLALVWHGFLGEETAGGAVVVKAASTAVIVAGVVGVSLL